MAKVSSRILPHRTINESNVPVVLLLGSIISKIIDLGAFGRYFHHSRLVCVDLIQCLDNFIPERVGCASQEQYRACADIAIGQNKVPPYRRPAIRT